MQTLVKVYSDFDTYPSSSKQISTRIAEIRAVCILSTTKAIYFVCSGDLARNVKRLASSCITVRQIVPSGLHIYLVE